MCIQPFEKAAALCISGYKELECPIKGVVERLECRQALSSAHVLRRLCVGLISTMEPTRFLPFKV